MDSQEQIRRTRAADIPGDLRVLGDLDDWEIVPGAIDPRGLRVRDPNGEEIGEIEDLLASPSTGRVHFAAVDSGSRKVLIPMELIELRDGSAVSSIPRARVEGAPEWTGRAEDIGAQAAFWSGAPERERAGEETGAEMRIPVMEERAEVERRVRTAGYVTLRKRVETEREHIAEPVRRTHVTVEHRLVPEGEAVQGDVHTLAPGESVRIPIHEEELEVHKRPHVAEEVVVRAAPETSIEERDVELERERVEVEGEGEVRGGRRGSGL